MAKKKILIVEDQLIVANDLRLALQKEGYNITGIAVSYNEALSMVQLEQPDLVLLDIYLKGRQTGIELARKLREQDIAFVYLSANSNQQVLEEAKTTDPYGFLVKPFRHKDLLVALEIAAYRHDHSLESKLHREDKLEKLLSQICVCDDEESEKAKMIKTAIAIQAHIPFDYMAVCRKVQGQYAYDTYGFLRVSFEEYQVIGSQEMMMISGLREKELATIIAASPLEEKAGFYNNEDFETICRNNPLKRLFAKTFQLQSGITIPLATTDGEMYTFVLYSRNSHLYDASHLLLLKRLKILLLEILITRFHPVSSGSQISYNNGRQADSTHGSNFKGIVGNSHQLMSVLDLVAQAAPLDTSILITGESGTGKERIADCIHDLSSRKGKPFIKVNCGALPPTLIESELFGHERGAFTGAVERRIGKFEQADGGTIFLDEIGEMTVDMQIKLLRVLQEKEIDRIGGKAPIKINVRFIAATNRHLEKEVADGRFRLDLYFRLNVFPVHLPALRERKQDIALIAEHLGKQISVRLNKLYNGMTKEMVDTLEEYPWPGNIRELENIVEQTVILNDGKSPLTLKRALKAVLPELASTAENYGNTIAPKTIMDIKRMHAETEKSQILLILKQTNGRIRGPGGAAEILNIKPTTLESRIIKLGIRKDDTSA